jgi:hypothetical protein
MSISEEISLELLLLDGSNYASWSASVLDIFRAMGPHIERIVDVSISPLVIIWPSYLKRKWNAYSTMLKLLMSYLVL